MEKRIKTYQYIIVGLIVLNALLIGWQWLGQRRPPRPEDILKKELQLTPVQMDQYRELIRQHRIVAGPLEQKIFSLKRKMLDYNTDSSKLEIAQQIGTNQVALEMSLYEHFKQVRAICSDDQKKKFDEVIFRALAEGRQPRPQPKH